MAESNRCVISVVIKARNEAAQLRNCIDSLAGFSDEVIVVDDHSDDETAEIARSLGARVIAAHSENGHIDELDKLGFAAASGRWILRMDADERMTAGLAQALMDAARGQDWAGVRFARKNIMFGGWARHGGWFRVDQLRFFRADAWDRIWDARALHGQVPVKGRILDLPLREDRAILHLNYDSPAQFVHRTLWLYAQADALALYQDGRRFSLWRLLYRPLRRFLGRYLIRQGWRDGARGAILAGFLAAYDFCIEANLWDIQRRQETPARGRE